MSSELRSFGRFLLTGGTSAVVNILARVLLSLVVSFELAVLLAYLVGMLTAYVLARRFVFRTSGRGVASEMVRFAAVNAVSLVQVWLVAVLLARYIFPAIGFTFHPELMAHAIAVASPVITSYYGHKLFTFSAARPRDEES
jgi:putative flippase GtrA